MDNMSTVFKTIDKAMLRLYLSIPYKLQFDHCFNIGRGMYVNRMLYTVGRLTGHLTDAFALVDLFRAIVFLL